MTIIRPFCGIRPAPGLAASIAALPYDVYNRAEAKEIVQSNPLSFLKIDRAETQFPDDIDMYSQSVYDRARDTFLEMQTEDSFIRDESDCFYLYALTMNGHTQTGIVGCASIDDYLNGTIRRHENTREDKESDRIRHVDALSAQTGPIFLAYRQNKALQHTIGHIKETPSLSDFVSEDGVRHQVWKISDTEICRKITRIFENISHIYIADGHHRAASAVKVGLKRRDAHPDYSGNEEFNYFLSVLFPAEELNIYDYNRVVDDLNGYEIEKLLAALQMNFHVDIIRQTNCISSSESIDSDMSDRTCRKTGFKNSFIGTDRQFRPAAKGDFSMYCNGIWYRLTAKPHLHKEDPVDNLDVSILQNTILGPLLGIKDPKTDSRIHFVGGIRGLEELVRLVDDRPGRIAFALYPTSMDELLAVADAGRLMPPKSTWFEPKLRSGLFIHEIERCRH